MLSRNSNGFAKFSFKTCNIIFSSRSLFSKISFIYYISISSCFSKSCLLFFQHIVSYNIVAIIVCICCTLYQKKCCLSLLSKNCAKYIQTEKKCKFAVLVVNFDAINCAIARLEQKKLKTKTIQKTTIKLICFQQVKLKQLRKQRHFLRTQKQKIFDKKLSNIKKLERLKNLKTATIIKNFLSSIIF